MATSDPPSYKVYRVVWGPQRFYLSLGWKTLIAFGLVVFLPLIGLLLLTTDSMRDSLEVEVSHALDANLNSALDGYRSPLEDVRIGLAQAADSPATAAALAAGDSDALHAVLLRQSRRFPYVDLWLAFDAEHVVRGRLNGALGIHPELTPGLTRRMLRLGEPVVSNELLPREVYLSEGPERFATLPPQVPSQVVLAPVPGEGFLVGLVALPQARWLVQRIQNRLTLQHAAVALIDTDSVLVTPPIAANPWNDGSHPWPQELGDAVRTGRSFQGRFDRHDAVTTLVVAEPLQISDLQPIAALAIAASTARISDHLAQNTRRIYVFIAIGIGLCLVVAYLAFRDTITPLQAIVNAQHEFASGNHRVRTEIETKDEFERLGAGFNRMADAVEEQHRRLEQYNALSSLVNLSMNPEDLLQSTLDQVITISGSQLGAIYLLEENSNRLAPFVTYALDIESLGVLKIGEGLPGQAALEKEVKRLHRIPENVRFDFKLGAGEIPPSELAYFPLIYRGELLGLLMLGTVTGYPDDEFVLLEHLSRQLAIILNDAIAQKKIRQLTLRDSLTGVSNRAHFTTVLEQAWSDALRYGTHLGLLMVDIDHFRQFADRYGYQVADSILTAVAGTLKKSLRKSDLVARFGENRFVIILPHSDLEQVVASGEKIRKNIIGTTLPQLERERITISIGAVSYPETVAQSPIELVRRANEVLQDAKQSGRNRVVAA